MRPTDINSYLGADLKAVKEIIHSRLSSHVNLLSSVNQGLLNNSGKMARPALCLLMAKACGDSCEDTLCYAAAVELLHNSTLLHDDVADESATRRGVPTVMSLYGPVPAVLVGDFWLARTLDTVLGTASFEWALKAFSKTLTDLSEGEMLQQEKSFGCDTTEEDYLRIIYGKTASLFELACTAAAKSVGASQEVFDAAAAYGRAVGLAFQIKDDILDYIGGDLGKPVAQDLSERKITLPLLGILDKVEDPEAVRRMVLEIPSHPENQAAVAQLVASHGGVEYAQARLHEYISQAISALEILPASQARDFLVEYARFNELRVK